MTKPYEPTAAEIKAACAEIQSQWTDYERWQRTTKKSVSPDYGKERHRQDEPEE